MSQKNNTIVCSEGFTMTPSNAPKKSPNTIKSQEQSPQPKQPQNISQNKK